MNLCYKTKPISCVEYHCLVVAEQRAVLRPGPPQQEAGRGAFGQTPHRFAPVMDICW